MCFLPMPCLKLIVFIGAAVSIVLSLGLLALTIYVNVEKKEVISTAGADFINAALITLYCSSIVFLLLGIAGLSGSMKGMGKKSIGGCLLGLYSIGVVVFFLVFLGSTIFFFVGPEAIFGTDCKQGSKTNIVNDLYVTSQATYATFCTADCPCYVTPADSDLALAIGPAGVSNNPSDPTKYQQCATPNPDVTAQSLLALQTLQNLLGCTGWCNNDALRYYRYTNINNCVTSDCLLNRQPCHDNLQNFMKSSGQTIGFGCIIATGICLINILAVCCICCHPSRIGKSKNFYKRMMETD